MQVTARFVFCGIAAALMAGAASAHHSRAATFDPNQKVTLTGTVTKLEWRNPHIWVFFDVTGADGEVVNWACEGSAPNALYRRGWRPDALQPGNRITVDGEVARNGTPNCNLRSVVLGDGKSVFAGDAGDSDDPGARR